MSQDTGSNQTRSILRNELLGPLSRLASAHDRLDASLYNFAGDLPTDDPFFIKRKQEDLKKGMGQVIDAKAEIEQAIKEIDAAVSELTNLLEPKSPS